MTSSPSVQHEPELRQHGMLLRSQGGAEDQALQRLARPMLTKGEEYTGQGQDYCEERCHERVIANLNRRAQQLGLQVVPVATPT